MDFFRKFFPITTKNLTRETTNNIRKTKDISAEITSPSQVDIITNISESHVTVNNIENKSIKDDSVKDDNDVSNSNKILHSLENVPPIEISRIDITTEPKTNEFEVIDDVVPETLTFNETIEENSVKNIVEDVTTHNTSKNDLELFKGTDVLVSNTETTVLNDVKLTYEPAMLNNVIDDETIQCLKEFDEALNNFDRSDNFRTEFVNLDDFYEIFDKLDNVVDDNSVMDPFDTKNEKEKGVKIYTDLKVVSNIIQDVDVISINSSTKDNESQTYDIKETIYINSDTDDDKSQSSDCEGYNSSDFEFISETEANMDGFIINFRREHAQNSSQTSSEGVNSVFGQINEEGINLDDAFDPGEGPSRLNRAKNQFEDRSYRDNHHIPIGDDYLALFQGIYNPVLPMSEIYFLENKSVRASAMNSQYDGIGFDKQLALRRHQPDSSEDEFADEAKECAKQILNTYPRENRKRRRRQ